VVKEKDGRRNRYHIQAHLPLPEPTSRERTVGEVLALLTGTGPAATCKPVAAAGTPVPAGTARAPRRKQVPGEPPANPGTAPPARQPAQRGTGREQAET